MKMKSFLSVAVAAAFTGLAGVSAAHEDTSMAVAAAMAAPDRPEAQVKRDAARNPGPVLTFSKIKPGDTVADLGAGGAYFTMIISGLVGEGGKVYAQNPPDWIEKFKGIAPKLEALEKTRPNVKTWTVPFDKLGFEDNSLDAVTMALIYHDITLLPTDRAAMNRQIYAALKPGGIYLITDHHAIAGTGDTLTNDLHRIDADFVRKEVEAAGFVLDGQSDALHFASDDRTKIVFDPSVRGQTDRFVYRFIKAK